MKCSSGCFSQAILPTNVKYFKEDIFTENLVIPPEKPRIERVLNVMTWPEVSSFKIIDTPVGYSNEGQRLTGVKLLADVKIKEKITYVANEVTQPVHATHYEFFKSVFIILPTSINNVPIKDLYASDRITVSPYVEAVQYRTLDCDTIQQCVMLFVNVNVC